MPNPCCYSCGESFPPYTVKRTSATEIRMTVYHGVEGDEEARAIVICTQCMDRGGYDMWTDKREWEGTTSLLPYSALPFLRDDEHRDDPNQYPSLARLLAQEETP